MLAFSYKRFSSKHQAQGMSIERQTKLAEEYCEKNQLELSTLTFEDLGVSAWTGSNTKEDAGLGQFIQALEKGKIKTPCYLLVESLDRLSRANIKEAMSQLWKITDYGVTVVTLLDGRSYTQAMDFTDFLMAGLVMERANEESETKSKRLKAVWAKKRAEKAMHSNTPFWIDRTGEGYKLNHYSGVVRRIFELSSEGLGHYSITGILNKEQVFSPSGKGWNGSTISKMLRSRTVIGEYQPNTVVNKVASPIGDCIVDYYPSAIDVELFNKVQTGVNQRLKKYKSSRGGSTSTHRNVLRDIGKCSCGAYLSLVKKRKRYYLHCIASRSQLCSKRAIQMDAFEKWLRQYFISPRYHNHWVDSSTKNGDIDIKISNLTLDRDAKQQALQGLLSVTEKLSNPLVLKKVSDLSGELEELVEAIEELEQNRVVSLNKQQNMMETIQLLNTAFSTEDNQDNLSGRIKLKQLLNATFDYFEITRIDSENGKVLHYQIELGLAQSTYKYKSIEAPTALQNAQKRQIWFHL